MSRLFFNGQLYITPTTVSAVNDSALANSSLQVGNALALIGSASGGAPKTPLVFSNPVDAAAVLIDGPLLTAVKKAFAPSSETPAPNQVIAMRVDPATQAVLALKDAATNTVINLTSSIYGEAGNGDKIKVQAGSTSGLLVTSQRGVNSYAQDNLARSAFSLQYTGAQASATIDVTGTTVVLKAPSSAGGTTIDLTQVKTVGDLVNRINAVAGFAATLLDPNPARATLNALDYYTAQDVRTAVFTVKADLQAVIDYINGISGGFFTAVRPSNAGAPPAVLAFTFLAGATNGSITNTDWSNCFTALQLVDCQWFVPLSPDPAVHAMATAHGIFMSGAGRKERRTLFGLDVGSTIAQVVSAAAAVNNDRSSEVYPGYKDFDANGTLTLYPPYMTAALVAAMAAGVPPGTPLTNKQMNVRGLEFDIKNPTDTDALINGGVLCCENTPQGFKVVQSISTWLVNRNFNRTEISTGAAVDYAVRSVRLALDVLRGDRGSPQLLGRAMQITDTTLRALSVQPPNGPGVLVGDAVNPAYKNIQVSLVNDALYVAFQGSPVIPDNYIAITMYAVPFSSSLSSTPAP